MSLRGAVAIVLSGVTLASPVSATVVTPDDRSLVVVPRRLAIPLTREALVGTWHSGPRARDVITIRSPRGAVATVSDDRFESTGEWGDAEYMGAYFLGGGRRDEETGMLRIHAIAGDRLRAVFLTVGGIAVHTETWGREPVHVSRGSREAIDARRPRTPKPDDPALDPGYGEGQPPEAVMRVPIRCPQGSRRGTVMVRMRVGIDGKVAEATVVRSVPGLDAAAIDAARRWRFRPAMSWDGKPQPAWVQIPLSCPSP